MQQLLITGLTLLSFAQTEVQPPTLKGETLSFELADLDGNVVSSTDERFAGKVVLVDLWGTWCPPCRKAIPVLVELNDRLEAEGLVVVGIAFEYADSAEARRSRVREFAKKFSVEYLLLDGGGDPDSSLMEALPDISANHAFPTLFVIGRDGKVAYSKSGFKAGDEATIEAEVERIINESTAKQSVQQQEPEQAQR